MKPFLATANIDYTIAIVEDDTTLREELAFQLRHLGFLVETFGSAPPFYRHLAAHPRTIAVLDIGLDGEDGLEIAHYLRTNDHQIALIFLTARGLHEERMQGLAMGADAYLTKPVDLHELALILQRQIQRLQSLAPNAQAVAPASDEITPWQLNLEGACLVAPNRVKVSLTAVELELVGWLLAREDQVCSHAELGIALRLLPEEFDKHRIEVIVSRLRAKVQRQTGLVLPLHSLRGQGYRFASVALGDEP